MAREEIEKQAPAGVTLVERPPAARADGYREAPGTALGPLSVELRWKQGLVPIVLITALWWTVTLAFFVLSFGVQPAAWPLSSLFFAVPFFGIGSRFVYGCVFGLFSRATLSIDAERVRAREFHVLIPPREIVIPTDTITSIDMHPRRPPNGHLTYDLVAKRGTGEDITLLESPYLPQGQFVAARLQRWVDAHHGRSSGHPATAPSD